MNKLMSLAAIGLLASVSFASAQTMTGPTTSMSNDRAMTRGDGVQNRDNFREQNQTTPSQSKMDHRSRYESRNGMKYQDRVEREREWTPLAIPGQILGGSGRVADRLLGQDGRYY